MKFTSKRNTLIKGRAISLEFIHLAHAFLCLLHKEPNGKDLYHTDIMKEFLWIKEG